MHNRRSFFGRLLGAAVAPLVPSPKIKTVELIREELALPPTTPDAHFAHMASTVAFPINYGEQVLIRRSSGNLIQLYAGYYGWTQNANNANAWSPESAEEVIHEFEKQFPLDTFDIQSWTLGGWCQCGDLIKVNGNRTCDPTTFDQCPAQNERSTVAK